MRDSLLHTEDLSNQTPTTQTEPSMPTTSTIQPYSYNDSAGKTPQEAAVSAVNASAFLVHAASANELHTSLNRSPTSPNAARPESNAETPEEVLSWGKVSCEMLKQAGPNVLRGTIVAGRYFLTAYFLGKIDERLLAPNTLILLLESMLVTLGSRSLNSIQTEIGILKGAVLKGTGTIGDIGPVVRQGSVLAMLLGLFIGAIYYFANHHFLQLAGQHDFAVDEARKYFQAAAPGFLALMLFTVQQRFFQGIKCSIAALYSSCLHSTLVVGFSYPFMFGKWGLPKLSLEGAGYAFTAATWSTLIIHTGYLLCAKSLTQYNIFKTKDTFNLNKIIQLARVGIPSGVQFALDNAANLANSLILGRVGGLIALTADQVSLQVAQIINIANTGLGGAINTCISHAIGEKKYHSLKRYAHIGMSMGTVLPMLAFVLLLPLHETFTSIFLDTNNPHNKVIVDLAKYFLLLECLRQWVTGIQVTTSSALQGLKDTKFPMMATIGFAFFANLALLFLLADVAKSNLQTIYASKAVGFFMTALFNFQRWIVKSHEVSAEDKETVQKKSYAQRFFRAMSLTCRKHDKAAISLVGGAYSVC